MNAEAFTLKARRTTRVPLRVPVQLGIEEGGAAKTLDGWTVIVNIHGAKIESKRKMQVGEQVKVTVPLTRKTQSGKVVWCAEQASPNGNFEFAIELTEPGNLWGVGFPPSDWKEARAKEGPVAVENELAPRAIVKPLAPVNPPVVAATPAVSTPPMPAATVVAPALASAPAPAPATPAVKKISVAGYQPQPIAPFTVKKGAAPAMPAVNEPISVAELNAPARPQPAAPVAAEIIETAPAPVRAELPAVQPLPELPMGVSEIVMPQEVTQPETALVPELATLNVAPAAAAAQTDPSAADMLQWLSSRAGDSPEQPAPLPMEQLFSGPAEALPAPVDAPLALELEPTPAAVAEVMETAAVVAPELEIPLEMPATEPAAILEVALPELPVAAPQASVPAPVAAAVSPFAPPTAPAATPAPVVATASEQPAARLTEQAETAFQTRIEGILDRACERAGDGLQTKMAEMESSSLERVSKRLSAVCEDHYERLDQQAESLTAGRRLEFEQGLAKFADASDEAARNRSQEMISRTEQDLRRRAQEISLHAQGQVQRHAAEAVEAAQSSMAARLQDLLPALDQAQSKAAAAVAQVQLQATESVELARRQTGEVVEAAQASLKSKLDELAPAIEQQVTELSRQQAEKIHYLHRGQFEAALSSRIEEARAYWQDHMLSVEREASSKLSDTVEKCMAQQSKLLLQQMESALTQMAAQVQKTFFKHVVDELTRQQQTWMAQSQRRMENLADRGMQQVRQQMMQLLGAMGEALVRDSLPEGTLTDTESAEEDSRRQPQLF